MPTYEDIVKQGYTGNYRKQIEEAQKNKPTYVNAREAQLSGLYDRIANREPFTYDVNGDALYQQYKNQYQTLGRQAMKDTMGQAANLTGGYGSTYSQSVGQQAYNAYLQQLNNIVPDLYDRAYSRYNQETADLYNLYGLERDLEQTDYSRFQDTLSDYWTNLSYLQDADTTEYNRYTDAENTLYNRQKYEDETAYERQQNEAKTAYEQQQDYYNRLVNLMTQTGYNPTDDELAQAGMSRAQADAYRSYYAQQQAAAAAGGSSGGGGGGRSYSSGGSGGSSSSNTKQNSSTSNTTKTYTEPSSRVGNTSSLSNVTSAAVNGGSQKYTPLITATQNIVSSGGKPDLRVVSTAADGGAGYFYDSKTQKTYKANSMEEAARMARQEMARRIMSEKQWNSNKSGYNSYNQYLAAYQKWATS